MILINSGPAADDPRRRLLVRALTASLFYAVSGSAAAQGSFFGARPARLPPHQSIYRLAGTVMVNEREANLQTQIRAGDSVETLKDSELIFVVGGNSMILRGESRLVISGPAQRTETSSLIITGLRILTGRILSVSRNQPIRVETAVATIGIRGTGFYVESDPQQTYFCTCYGETEVTSNTDPESKETIQAKQHDQPVYIVADGGRGRNIRSAPVINHSNQELELIETLVGRKPPFVDSPDFGGPRRGY